MAKVASSNRKSLFHSIGFELLAYYLSISIIVLALGSWLVYNSTISVLQKRSEEYIHEQFKQSELNIKNLASEADRLTLLFSNDSDIQDLMKAASIGYSYESVAIQQNVLKKMDEYIRSNNLVNSIYIFTGSGMLGSSQYRSIVLPGGNSHAFYESGVYDKAMDEYPRAVLSAGITDQWFYRIAGSSTLHYLASFARAAKPMMSAKLSCVIVFNIDEQKLCDTYSMLAGTGSGTTYIMDSNGIVISSVAKQDIGEKGSFMPKAGVDFESFSMNSKDGGRLVVYYKLSSTDWFIVREIPMGLFQNDVNSLRTIIVIVLAVSILLIIVASFLSMKRITGPLGSLAARMKDMGKGNLGVTIDNIPRNELGLVTARFNEMSLNIRDLVEKNTKAEREKKALEMGGAAIPDQPPFPLQHAEYDQMDGRCAQG